MVNERDRERYRQTDRDREGRRQGEKERVLYAHLVAFFTYFILSRFFVLNQLPNSICTRHSLPTSDYV